MLSSLARISFVYAGLLRSVALPPPRVVTLLHLETCLPSIWPSTALVTVALPCHAAPLRASCYALGQRGVLLPRVCKHCCLCLWFCARTLLAIARCCSRVVCVVRLCSLFALLRFSHRLGLPLFAGLIDPDDAVDISSRLLLLALCCCRRHRLRVTALDGGLHEHSCLSIDEALRDHAVDISSCLLPLALCCRRRRRSARSERLAAVRKVAEVAGGIFAFDLPTLAQHCLVVARPVLLPPPTPLR